MEFKDYYATLGLERTASHDQIKRTYRKLARKYHPDLNKDAQAEDRFKEVAEAHEALIDPERRAAYDALQLRHDRGEPFESPPDRDGRGQRAATEADLNDFFASLFGHAASVRGSADRRRQASGEDQHANVVIDLDDAYRGAKRRISLSVPILQSDGRETVQERQLDVDIPKGLRQGQHLRLAGLGSPGRGGGPPGDLYLEITLRSKAPFRVDGGDVYLDLPISPWEAALGATVSAPTPVGDVQLTIPAGSTQGRKLRLKGRGLPGKTPGDLYAVLGIAVPTARSEVQSSAYDALAAAFPEFDPRSGLRT